MRLNGLLALPYPDKGVVPRLVIPPRIGSLVVLISRSDSRDVPPASRDAWLACWPWLERWFSFVRWSCCACSSRDVEVLGVAMTILLPSDCSLRARLAHATVGRRFAATSMPI